MGAIFQKIWQFVTALGINFVPASGFFLGGWSPATTLGVYWFENVASSLLVALRIALQSWLAPRQGHLHYEARNGARKGNGSLLSYFLPMSLIFSFGHGVFLAALFFVLTANGHGAAVAIDWADLAKGAGMVFALLFSNFVVDLWGLRTRPFAWIERLMGVNLSRVLLVQFTIVFGMLAVALTGMNTAFVGVFVALKTLADLSNLLPAWNPKVAPVWLCRIMQSFPSASSGKSFAELFAENLEGEVARRARNEGAVKVLR